MYGSTFRQIREKCGVSLDKAAKGIVSPSTLSRWERGKGEIYFDNVLKLLKKLEINLNEFFGANYHSFNEEVAQRINAAYADADSVKLKKMTIIQLKKYEKTQQLNTLFLAASASNFYFELTRECIFPINYQIKLRNILSDIENWDNFSINLFNHSINFLPVGQTFNIAKRIINRIEEIQGCNSDNFYTAISAILNALVKLIVRDAKCAEKLVDRIQGITVPATFLYLNVKRAFLIELLNYRMYRNYSIKRMNQIVLFLRKMNADNLAASLCRSFKQVKELDN